MIGLCVWRCAAFLLLRDYLLLLFFFFFQAEDGIRDLTVTGVQTCALPIYFLLLGSLWPQDLEVVRTLLEGTRLTYEVVPIDPAHGLVPWAALEQQALAQAEGLAGIAFPQVNSLGCLEDVDGPTDLAHRLWARATVLTDPILLGSGGPGTGRGGHARGVCRGAYQCPHRGTCAVAGAWGASGVP